MKFYAITMRNGTVTNTHNVSRSNAKRARRHVAGLYADAPGWSIYRMHRTG